MSELTDVIIENEISEIQNREGFRLFQYILSDRNVIYSAPTGAGKTRIAYFAYVHLRYYGKLHPEEGIKEKMLVIVPNNSLFKVWVNEAYKVSPQLKAVDIDSIDTIFNENKKYKGSVPRKVIENLNDMDVLVITPHRLKNRLDGNGRGSGWVKEFVSKATLTVLDEGDLLHAYHLNGSIEEVDRNPIRKNKNYEEAISKVEILSNNNKSRMRYIILTATPTSHSDNNKSKEKETRRYLDEGFSFISVPDDVSRIFKGEYENYIIGNNINDKYKDLFNKYLDIMKYIKSKIENVQKEIKLKDPHTRSGRMAMYQTRAYIKKAIKDAETSEVFKKAIKEETDPYEKEYLKELFLESWKISYLQAMVELLNYITKPTHVEEIEKKLKIDKELFPKNVYEHIISQLEEYKKLYYKITKNKEAKVEVNEYNNLNSLYDKIFNEIDNMEEQKFVDEQKETKVPTPKLIEIVNYIKNNKDKRIGIFVDDIKTSMEHIAYELDLNGIKYVKINGKAKGGYRNQLLEEIKEGYVRVAIITRKTSGRGLNLNKYNFDVLIGATSAYDSDELNQMIGRARDRKFILLRYEDEKELHRYVKNALPQNRIDTSSAYKSALHGAQILIKGGKR